LTAAWRRCSRYSGCHCWRDIKMQKNIFYFIFVLANFFVSIKIYFVFFSKYIFYVGVPLLSIPLGLSPPPSREKIWREKLFLGLVQNESKAHRLISICTKPRKSFYHQFFALDKPSGIDNKRLLPNPNVGGDGSFCD
jgi:hypothetical protein